MDGKQKCMAVRIAGEPDAGFLRRAEEEWGALLVEIFPGREESLVLIRPAEGVYIDPRAAELLRRSGDGT